MQRLSVKYAGALTENKSNFPDLVCGLCADLFENLRGLSTDFKQTLGVFYGKNEAAFSVLSNGLSPSFRRL